MHIDHVPIELMFSCKTFIAFLTSKFAIIFVRVTQQMRSERPFLVEASRTHIASNTNIKNRTEESVSISIRLIDSTLYSRECIRIDVPADMMQNSSAHNVLFVATLEICSLYIVLLQIVFFRGQP